MVNKYDPFLAASLQKKKIEKQKEEEKKTAKKKEYRTSKKGNA